MTITRPGRAMLSSIGDAAERTVGTAASELPTFADIPVPAFASQAEAETGTDAVTHMSPVRTAQAVAALGLGLRRGGSLDLSSGVGGTVTEMGGTANPDLLEIWFAGVSVSGSDHLLIQLGDSGGIATTGYVSASGASSGGGTFASSTSGLVIYQGGAGVWTGCMRLHHMAGNLWVASHALQQSASGGVTAGGGQVTLSGTLDRVAVAASGADTFNGGTLRVLAGKAG